jgi:hypothetical protein
MAARRVPPGSALFSSPAPSNVHASAPCRTCFLSCWSAAAAATNITPNAGRRAISPACYDRRSDQRSPSAATTWYSRCAVSLMSSINPHTIGRRLPFSRTLRDTSMSGTCFSCLVATGTTAVIALHTVAPLYLPKVPKAARTRAISCEQAGPGAAMPGDILGSGNFRVVPARPSSNHFRSKRRNCIESRGHSGVLLRGRDGAEAANLHSAVVSAPTRQPHSLTLGPRPRPNDLPVAQRRRAIFPKSLGR